MTWYVSRSGHLIKRWVEGERGKGGLMRCLILVMGLGLCVGCEALGSSDMDKGLVAHYVFDEGRGTTVGDSSAARRAGRAYGVKWAERDGRTALRFNGKSGHVDIGEDVRLKLDDKVSVSAWVCATGSPSGEPVVVGPDPD